MKASTFVVKFNECVEATDLAILLEGFAKKQGVLKSTKTNRRLEYFGVSTSWDIPYLKRTKKEAGQK